MWCVDIEAVSAICTCILELESNRNKYFELTKNDTKQYDLLCSKVERSLWDKREREQKFIMGKSLNISSKLLFGLLVTSLVLFGQASFIYKDFNITDGLQVDDYIFLFWSF